MTTTLQPFHAALRIIAGLLFVFMASSASLAQGQPPAPAPWASNAASSIANTDGGDGTTIDHPILIATAGELAYLAKQVNGGGQLLNLDNGGNIDKSGVNRYEGFSGYYFALSNDIELKGEEWTPIGDGNYYTFRAHFDGKGYKVKGLKMKIESTSDNVFAGLFGKVYDATLQNLGVELADEGIEVSTTGLAVYVGGIAGRITAESAKATLRNCYVEGKGTIKITKTGDGWDAYAGGIAGYANANTKSLTLTHCYTTVDVEAKGSRECNVGGIAGFMSGTLSYTYATGLVTAKEGTSQRAGGICGRRSNGELSYNLALNQNVYGSGDNIHRIVGTTSTKNVSNYANPGVLINGNPVVNNTPSSPDGSNTSLEYFEEVLKNAPDNDNDWSAAWTFPEGKLPQLKTVTDDGSGNLSFAEWPDHSPQPVLNAGDYLKPFIWSDYAATSIANKGGNDGTTIDHPILIATAGELAYLAQQVNAGGRVLTLDNGTSIDNSSIATTGFSGYYFALSADIELEGKEWTPIGNSSYATFRAHFDGKGYKVKGVKMKIESDDITVPVYAGLFGQVIDGTLQNLGVELADEGIKASSTGDNVYAGGIAGSIQAYNANATLRNCYVEGTGAIKITGTGDRGEANAGGIAGTADAASTNTFTLTHCYATVDVEAKGADQCNVGGIAGYVDGTLSYTYATGRVTATGGTSQRTGGICGHHNGGELSNSLALNKGVSGTGDNIHRIVGYSLNPTNLNTFSNYANPGVNVNGNPVVNNTPSSPDGSNTSLEYFEEVLKNAPDNDNDWSAAWTFPEGKLPQLKTVTDDGSGNLSFAEWPDHSPQPVLNAGDYLKPFIWSDYAATSIANTDGGDGTTIDHPILIATAGELAYLAQQVNAGGRVLTLDNGISIDKSSETSDEGFSGYYFALANDINLEGKEWTPIGNGTPSTFRAHFDGKGYKVKGVRVKIESDDTTVSVYAGLFGYVIDATLQNLGVELADDGIEASSTGNEVYAGGIVGKILEYYANTTLRNCYVEGTGSIKITGTGKGYSAYAGGIAGTADGPTFYTLTLTHCYATVDVEAKASRDCIVGGIVGYIAGFSTLSYTYTTGLVTATGGTRQWAGGICGCRDDGQLSNNLALNKGISGTGDRKDIHRIVGYSGYPDYSKNISNYANPGMPLNGTPVNTDDATSYDGADTYRETVTDDLKGTPSALTAWADAWQWTADGKSPRLKLVEEASDGSLSYPGDLLSGQTPDDAFSTLPALPRLHIVAATGGTLTVTAVTTTGQSPLPVADGDALRPGTPLTLSYSTEANYHFEGFRYGSASATVDTPLSGTTVDMPRTDLWLKADFRYEAPVPPTPVYYNVTLPDVDGATTDPVPGTYSVEAWGTFRFYLTLDADCSESQPVVTTDRGETLTPRTSDGAYLVKNVRSDIAIRIDGITLNPVANEPITAPDAPQLWTEAGTLCIRTASLTDTAGAPLTVRIVTADGRLLHAFRLSEEVTRLSLPAGFYIVRIGQTSAKVIVK